MKKRKSIKRRNPYALPALMRRAGAFLDKKKERLKKLCRKKVEDD